MKNLNLKSIPKNKKYEPNTLYRINSGEEVLFEELHDESDGKQKHKEIVRLKYILEDKQYGIYAKEYRNVLFVKDDMKKADILACVVDDKNKRIHSFIMDVKSNISAFSDDLYKNDALITVIKEVRDFINQLADEKVSKDGIFYLYKSEGYNEEETFGIVTKSFEKNKFLDASEMIETVLNRNGNLNDLSFLKFYNSLKPYKSEIKKLRDFSKQKITICDRQFDLNVYLLSNIDEYISEASIEICIS